MRDLVVLTSHDLGVTAKRIKELTGRPWTSGSTVKAAFRGAALKHQNFKCVYCLVPIGDNVRNAPDIEHFADKGKYGQWSFELANLMLACKFCNQTLKKTYDVVSILHANYQVCAFRIVHPYFDQVGQHIDGGFSLESVPPEVPRPKTLKGARTIRLFDLKSPYIIRRWAGEHLDYLRRSDFSSKEIEEYEKCLRELDGY